MAWWLRQNSCLVWEAKREGEPNGHINDLFFHPNRTRAAIGWQCSCVSSESSRALDAGERTCGDIGLVRLGSRSLLLVSSPELIHAVLVEPADHFAKNPPFRRVM